MLQKRCILISGSNYLSALVYAFYSRENKISLQEFCQIRCQVPFNLNLFLTPAINFKINRIRKFQLFFQVQVNILQEMRNFCVPNNLNTPEIIFKMSRYLQLPLHNLLLDNCVSREHQSISYSKVNTLYPAALKRIAFAS